MSGAARQILIVEDDEAHAELIRRGFEGFPGSAATVVVRTLRAAQQRLEEAIPDLVITDLRLPDGDGGELIEPDREQARYPVVVMTSFGDQQVAVGAMRTGAIDYVVKSDITLAQMGQIAERALREWQHIVERRNAERALRRSEEHFRSLIENALDLILVLDPDGRFRYVSPSVRRTLLLEPEALAGSSAFDLVHPDDHAPLREALRLALAQPGQPQASSLRLRGQDGEWRVFEAIGQAQRAAQPEPFVVVNARDVTERLKAEESRRELEAQLRQAQRLETLGTLAGGIAHDFNNILQAVMGCAELARGKVGPEHPARRYLDRALEVSRRGRDVVEQILQFSRRRTSHLRPIALRDVVEEVVKLLRTTFPRSIEISDRLETSGVVVADASQLHQVLMNLATNARQAMAGAGRLEIALEPAPAGVPLPAGLNAGSYLVLRVSDDGPGIAADVKERIFEPFFTTKGVGEGTGLGLSVAHGIIQAHGGAIACESEPGQGTSFRVYLAEVRRPTPETAAAAPVATAARQARVLFVDPDVNVVFVAKSLLEGLGHRVTTAASGIEALELLSRQPQAFDLLIADDAMPRMTGTQLSHEARRLRPNLPAIISFGHGLPAAAQFSDEGGLTYLRKPFEESELASAVRMALT